MLFYCSAPIILLLIILPKLFGCGSAALRFMCFFVAIHSVQVADEGERRSFSPLCGVKQCYTFQ